MLETLEQDLLKGLMKLQSLKEEKRRNLLIPLIMSINLKMIYIYQEEKKVGNPQRKDFTLVN